MRIDMDMRFSRIFTFDSDDNKKKNVKIYKKKM